MVKYQELNYNGNTLRGFLYEPVNEYDTIIIAYHGFQGSTSSMYLLFSEFAKQLVKENIGVLMYDFLGSGNSDLTFEHTLISEQINQAKFIQEDAKKYNKKLVTMGHSMGGYVCFNAVNNDIDKCILLAPAVSHTVFAQLLDNEYVYGTKLNANFKEDVLSIEESFNFDNETIIIQGMNDVLTPDLGVSLFAAEHENIEFLGLDDMDHFFLDYFNREYMIETITKFINGEEY